MGSSPSQEFRGSETAPHYVLINYCGGWGYAKYAYAIVDRVEQKYPGQFRFELLPDNGTTGRLEVTLFPNSKDANGKNGIEVHSKAKGQDYVHKDWAGFETRFANAVAQASNWVINIHQPWHTWEFTWLTWEMSEA